MSYQRVIPRDLFNEAKLLKCLGQLALLIHEGFNIPAGLTLRHSRPEKGFIIDQDDSSGGLYCRNLSLRVHGRKLTLQSCYNSKSPYPLCYDDGADEGGTVFNDDGTLSEEFVDYANRLAVSKA